MSLPDWTGETCVVLAGGPSLHGDDLVAVRNAKVRTIVVNSTFRRALWADVVFGLDLMWWKQHITEIRRTWAYSHFWTSDRSAAERYGLQFIRGTGGAGLDIKHVRSNGNSGAAAINLAYLFGCRRVLLLGFDMKLGANGEKHHHPDHPAQCVQAQVFKEWINNMDYVARDAEKLGLEIINCTRDTALACFPKATIEQALCQK